MNSKDFIGGLFIGAAVGIAAGILLAPEKGSDTMKKLSGAIKDRLNQWKGNAEEWSEEVTEKGEDFLNKAGNQARDYFQDARDKVDDLESSTNRAIS